MVCSLFGHRKCGEDMTKRLFEAAEKLIKENGVDSFFIGNQGDFDKAGINALSALKEKYLHIRCYVVAAYPSINKSDSGLKNFGDLDVIYPVELSLVSSKEAIPQRNKWMARQADYVLCYIDHNNGGAAASVRYAEHLEKKIVNIGSWIYI